MHWITRQNERLRHLDIMVIINVLLTRPLRLIPTKHHAPGFSLFEMLVVIAVVGILCGVALNWYGGNLRAGVERVGHQRNAQEIVSMGVCATMSGADFVVKGDKLATSLNLIVGVTGRQGTWKGQIFRLGGLKPADLPGAMPFVKFESGLLLYDPSGLQPSS